MKKLLYCAAALAMTLFAGSCQRENLEPVVDGGVTYTITLDDGVQTKGSNGYAEYDLYYQVYKTVDPTELETALILTENHVEMSGNTTNISLELLNDQDYTILFWANKKGENYYDVTDLRNVQVKESLSNNDSRDAFCAKDELINFDANLSKEVKLKRPFAQINIATLIPAVDYDVTPLSSMVRVSDVPLAYNVATAASVGSEQTVTFGNADVPPFKLTVNEEDYKMVAMNYVVVPDGNIDELYYEITTANGVVKNSVNNIPVKPNYRTNIIGNLLTSNATYTVEIVPVFADPDGTGNMEVLTNGIVKNLNGDYEITNSNGLVYAIENLFKNTNDNGVFYVLNSIDMTGVGFNPADVPNGKVVNIIGEMPLVTRSTTSTTGIVITGLNQPLIDNVATGANASFTNIYIEDYQGTGPALVANNEGTVAISGCNASDASDNAVELVGGNVPVDAGNVTSEVELNAALASTIAEISLGADLEAESVIEVTRSVVINGNGHKLTTSANRAFRLKSSDIEVIINELNIISTAVMVYPSDVRGVSIDPSLSNITLTLNNCSIDFTDKTTNDWTYAVNVSGNGTGHKVTVLGGTYEGANVINVHGAKNTVTVKDATLNCLYPKSDLYCGACIWVLQNQESSVYAEGNTFNGNNAVAFNLGSGTVLVENNNVDNTMRYYTDSETGDVVYYVVSAKKFQDAVNNATQKSVIKFAADIIGDVTIVQKEGVTLVIDGENHKYNGTITVDGNNRNDGAESLTIKNIVFESETAKTFVSAPGELNGNKERYSHNVIVEDCTFYSPSYNEGIGAISTQKTYHFTVKNCTAENIHSLLQVQSCDNDVTVENVRVINCKNGISFGNTAFPTLKNAEINSKFYGVRGDADASRGTLKIENTTVNATQPIIIRKVKTDGYSVALNNVELNTDELYQVVFTKGSDDDAYVAPTNKYTVTGANDFIVYPREVAIATVEDFKSFATDVNNGNTYKGKKVYLVSDLDLNNEEWTPIGTSAKPFNGEFDGKNHTISNLVVNGGSNSDQGLFGRTNDGEIKNLTINNAKVSGRLNVGVLVGTPYTSKYTNIKVTGHVEVDGMAYVGGVGGKNAYANWTDVTVDVDKTSYVNANSVENGKAYRTYVGGVCGFNGEGSHTFTNIKSNIDVKGSTCDVGGLFGIAHYGNNFVNCSCSADVEIYNATEAAEAEEMGGIAGVWHNENGTKVTFTNCSFTGSLKSNFTAGVDLNDNTIVGAPYSATGTGELIIK